ncbi:MAG: hypothetical protein ED859_08945 [Desulfuromonadales bacterium]|nr:MAG: hypothetical protein ED859_08945 [Desulfuromonadales bacterium]
MKVVISQSMFFPWVGFLEQIRLADVFVYYDDVQFSKGSFTNRVQLKTGKGRSWLTVPLENLHLGQCINEVSIAPSVKWKERHLKLLMESLEGTTFFDDALELARKVYERTYPNIGTLARASMMALADYFGLTGEKTFIDVEQLQIVGNSSDRVLEIVKRLSGTTYITGLGALKYLEHEKFVAAGVNVRYMQYQCKPYPQMHGEFNPYVSGLDLVANCGRGGARFICSETIDWKELIYESR